MRIIINILLIFTFLISSTAFGQNKLKVTFNIKDWEGNPISSASIRIETYNKKQSSRGGRELFHISIDKNNKKNETKKTLKFNKTPFGRTAVTIFVFGPFDEYYKNFKQENVKLTDGQTFDIQLERDWDAYNNRKSKVSAVADYLPDDTLINLGYLTEFFNKSFQLEVLTDDFERTENDYAEVIFNVDNNCTLTNRNIVKNIIGMKADLVNDYLNAVEKELNKSKTKCVPMNSITIRIYWRFK